MARFEQAEKLSPDDPVIAYNIGLLLTEKRDFERARLYAQKAYAGGVQIAWLARQACSTGPVALAILRQGLRMATLLLPPAIQAKQPIGRT